jgi:CheY-like chemotaxis protein
MTTRVLVVDDNPDAALTLTMLIEFWGHEVKSARNGNEALDLGREFGPEVVLLDVGLPGMDGYEVARRMRSMPETASAYLVAVTGYGRAEDRREAMDAGFDKHLTKPVDPAILREMLDRIPESKA